MKNDYNWEYIKLVDKIIPIFIKEIKKTNSNSFKVEKIDLSRSVISILCVKLMQNNKRELYNHNRISGKKKENIQKQIITDLLLTYSKNTETFKLNPYIENLDNKISNIQKKRTLFYCINERQLKYILPLVNYISDPVTILCSFKIDNKVDIKEKIEVIEWTNYTENSYANNKYLQYNFPTVINDFGYFHSLIQATSPSVVVILEGCHDDMSTLSSVCILNNVKTICIQQGWPTFMNSRFRNMGYDYFFTWGEEFSKMFNKYNKKTVHIAAGYPYETKKKKQQYITFFLQPVSMTITKSHLYSLLKLSIFCAYQFPEIGIIVKEHPETQISRYYKKKLLQYKNIRIIGKVDISEVFSLTMISVSIYSSTLIESIAHGSIPFIFNPTSAPLYYPNLEKLKIAYSSRSLEQAQRKIKNIVSNKKGLDDILEKIKENKNTYFSRHGLESIKFITKNIEEIARK